MIVNILIDIPDSYLLEFVEIIIKKLKDLGHNVNFVQDHKKIIKGDMLFIMGAKTILNKEHLSLNKNNLVIHPSKLPGGRGSAALIWKILEGENKVYLTLFEANEKVDRGDIYIQESIKFEGFELSDEIRHKQALKHIEMILKYVKNHKNLKKQKQQGKSSFYPKRKPKDSELDIDKSIREQFNLLRVVDNKRYPAFFILHDQKYTIKIYRDKKVVSNEN